MVEKRITDGKRIAQLLSSELTGREIGVLDELAVVDADPDVVPTEDGGVAYSVAVEGNVFADVFVQPEQAYLELQTGLDAAMESAEDEGLRVRPKDTESPQALVFVETGAEVKGAVQVLVAAAEAYID